MTPHPLPHTSLHSSPLAYGCWRIATSGHDAKDLATSRAAIQAAVADGYVLFDLADIYCRGRSERFFGEVLAENPGMREKLVIATKCGIRFAGEPQADSPYRYDFSYDHIVRSCEESLRRLRVETIDLYQLHRPDWLMHPEEVARAFDHLRTSGKARHFGVSNFRPSQVELLQSAWMEPLVVNQIEVSLLQLAAFEDGTLDHCLQTGIAPLAWSPLGGGLLGEGATDILPSQKSYTPASAVAELDRIAADHGATRTAVALAWLLKHPARIIPLVGSTQPARIAAAAKAADLELSHEEWYRLLTAARSTPLP
jgi:predicted oxidoreductase